MSKATSKAAFLQLQLSGKENIQRRIVFNCIIRNTKRGLTCREISIKTGIEHSTVCARVNKLKEENCVAVDGCRKNPSKNSADVLKVHPDLLAKWEEVKHAA